MRPPPQREMGPALDDTPSRRRRSRALRAASPDSSSGEPFEPPPASAIDAGVRLLPSPCRLHHSSSRIELAQGMGTFAMAASYWPTLGQYVEGLEQAGKL